MKKIVSILLILSLCPSVCVIFASCDSSSGKSNGRLLPTTMKAPIDDEIVELPITWTENSCSVTIEGMKFTFTYDANNRTLSAAIVGENENYSVNNLCVFDENGKRVVSGSAQYAVRFKIAEWWETLKMKLFD